MGELATMKIELKTLKTNPVRDLAVDPIDKERVKALRKSIKDNGFWGGVVIGKLPNGGGYVTLAGHSRIEAAMQEGISHADLHITNGLTPLKMLTIYGVENATQRGTDNTAIVGTVAGAIRIIARGLLSGDSQFCESEVGAEKARNHLTSAKGLGEPIVTKFLSSVPGMGEAIVKQQIANLKASGDYARIISEVEKDIIAERVLAEEAVVKARSAKERAAAEAEIEAALKAEQSAAKASTTAKETPKTFDLGGVQRHLKTPSHVECFRKLVTGPLLKSILPIEQQAPLAKAIVASAKDSGFELTNKFIHDEAINAVVEFKQFVKAEDRKALKSAGVIEKAKRLQHHFARNIKGALGDAIDLVQLERDNKDIDIPRLEEFLTALGDVGKIAKRLEGFNNRRRIGNG